MSTAAMATARLRKSIPWPCLHEFLAIVTHPRIYAPPSSLDQAIAQIEAWFEAPNVNVLGETSDHWDHLKPLLRSSKIVGGAVHDGRKATCTPLIPCRKRYAPRTHSHRQVIHVTPIDRQTHFTSARSNVLLTFVKLALID